MTARKSIPDDVPPALSAHQAVALLQRQATRADEVAGLQFNDPRIEAWTNSTLNILTQTFGQPRGEMHRNTRDFAYAQSGVGLRVNMSDGEIQADHEGKTRVRQQLLRAYIEQIEDLAPPATSTRYGSGYRFTRRLNA